MTHQRANLETIHQREEDQKLIRELVRQRGDLQEAVDAWDKNCHDAWIALTSTREELEALRIEIAALRELAGELVEVLTEIAVEAGIYSGTVEFEKIEELAENALTKAAAALGVEGAKHG